MQRIRKPVITVQTKTLGYFSENLAMASENSVVALMAAQTKRVAVIRIQPLCLADKLLQITADDNALAVKVLPGRRETN